MSLSQFIFYELSAIYQKVVELDTNDDDNEVQQVENKL